MSSKLNLNINSLVVLLVSLFSCGKNAVYKTKDIAYRLVQAGIHNQSLEAMYKLTQYLSADRMLSKLHDIPVEETRKLLRKFNSKIKLPKLITLALDFTAKPYYGDKNHPDVMGFKGGKYVRNYVELSTVELPLCIDVMPVNQLNNDKLSLLTELLNTFYELYSQTKIKLLLVDRGFYVKKVVEFLTENKIDFIMPVIRNKAIQKLIKKYETGEIKDRIKYEFGKIWVNLLFIKIGDEVFVYMTNTRKSAVQAHLLYSKRWQIETNFREQNKFTFKTCSNDFAIRYLAFIIATLLFNAWQLTRRLMPYILESYVFKQIALEKLLKLWQEYSGTGVVKTSYYFLLA